MTMTKKDIVIKVSNDTNLTQIDVKKIVQKTLDTIVESLEKGETVELRNFGVFKVKSRKGRVGRNPRTGQEVSVPEKRVVVFKPGLVLKYKVK
ncbi:MAG: integration host factor subunit beta [Candidatus Omnitrophica bacterium]|nr:integration host factor subunit beta [Candidatus Omnitrophota bacterium]